MTSPPAEYVGLDVGGTYLKGARIDEDASFRLAELGPDNVVYA